MILAERLLQKMNIIFSQIQYAVSLDSALFVC